MQEPTIPAPRAIKIPGPDHPITLAHNPNRVVVTLGGHTIADSRETITLREANYPAVHYIPRKDVDMAALERTDHTTYCPYKGASGYFSLAGAGPRGVNAVWTYEDPYSSVKDIKDHVAFYPDRVESIVEHAA
jgi:uncharacterized protein (DUF427 family)